MAQISENTGNRLTSTQIGSVGEASIASGLILASKGRLAPFKPFADDDGIDLLIYDKMTRRSLPLQIKCRTRVDNAKSGTVQFDVRLSTFAVEGAGFLVAALLDGASVTTAWLVSTRDLSNLARNTRTKLVMVASTKPESSDRYRKYRHDTLEAVAATLIAHLESGSV